ncbi:hypothetical protein KY319_04735 [Candidatus Woesearchaeota archaeon]|nr:hypothetical protein [Candidatus Woesearchaeota archaeon]
MKYVQKAKDFVYKAARAGALTAAGIELLFAPGCYTNQPTMREQIRNEIKQTRADDARYAALTPEKQKEELKKDFDALLKDGKIEKEELPALAKILKRAKGTHQDIFTEAEKARDAYLKENPVEVFYVFAVRQGENMEWYFLEPERRQRLNGDLKEMTEALGVSLDELLAKAQASSFPGQTLPQRNWTQERFDSYNDFLWRETVRIPHGRISEVAKYFPQGILTDGMLTVTADEHDFFGKNGRIVNALLYAIPAEKPKAENPADKDKPAEGAKPADGATPTEGAAPAEGAKPADGATPTEQPKD